MLINADFKILFLTIGLLAVGILSLLIKIGDKKRKNILRETKIASLFKSKKKVDCGLIRQIQSFHYQKYLDFADTLTQWDDFIQNVTNQLFIDLNEQVTAIAYFDYLEKFTLVELACSKHKERIEVSLFEELVNSENKILATDKCPFSASSSFLVHAKFPYLLTKQIRYKDSVKGVFVVLFEESKINSQEIVVEILDHIASIIRPLLSLSVKVREEKDKFKFERDLLVGLSHDLKSPSIHGSLAASHLMHADRPEETKENLILIKNCFEDQLEIIQNILDYVKYQNNQLEVSNGSCNLTIIDQLISQYQINAESRDMFIVEGERPNYNLSISPMIVKRIVGNFLTNAIKYAGKGIIEISYKVREEYVEIVVSDNGPGIKAEDRERLFDSFNRFSSSSFVDGLGFGLWMSKILAERNGGYVFYQDNKPNGAMFGVGFKATSASDHVASKKYNHIVIIEDYHLHSKFISRLVSASADKISSHDNFIDAFRDINISKPDLIISDFNVQAFKLTDLLEKLIQNQLYIPTVIITGEDENLVRSRIKELNLINYPIEFLRKPINKEEIIQAISNDSIGNSIQ